jgi:hypothetical protein
MAAMGPRDDRLADKPDAYYAVHGVCPPGTVWECRLSDTGFLEAMRAQGEEAVPLKPRKPYTRKATN